MSVDAVVEVSQRGVLDMSYGRVPFRVPDYMRRGCVAFRTSSVFHFACCFGFHCMNVTDGWSFAVWLIPECSQSVPSSQMAAVLAVRPVLHQTSAVLYEIICQSVPSSKLMAQRDIGFFV
jgi:hypothetical protein